MTDADDDEVDQGCCDGTCDDSCGGYGKMLEGTRRVAFIGHPATGKSELAGCCGERDGIPPDEEIFELPGFVGMIHGGKADLARRAKDIARGTTAFSPGERDEALKRIVAEDDELLRRLASNDGPIDGSSGSAQ